MVLKSFASPSVHLRALELLPAEGALVPDLWDALLRAAASPYGAVRTAGLKAIEAWGPRQTPEAVEALTKKLLREDAQGRRTGLALLPQVLAVTPRSCLRDVLELTGDADVSVRHAAQKLLKRYPEALVQHLQAEQLEERCRPWGFVPKFAESEDEEDEAATAVALSAGTPAAEP